ncbi:hypothetical protein QKW60_15965 [Defluviimonas aestuarii]|uniref:hypothetical protein n=1 Tax=Albidovulum aestuarii TaxID=1130726 RepID=UPI00249AB92C|nr:hypothetical protein [Defluviimonas aestuarii]MDI3337907.1 hypothetical protein [Defluviimonas aestuarii]
MEMFPLQLPESVQEHRYSADQMVQRRQDIGRCCKKSTRGPYRALDLKLVLRRVQALRVYKREGEKQQRLQPDRGNGHRRSRRSISGPVEPGKEL